MEQIINQLIQKSQNPINDFWLEGLQNEFGQHHNYYRFLYHIVDTFKPPISIEIGSWFGIGAAYMAQAAGQFGGKVIAVDPNPHEMLVSILPKRFDNFTYIQGSSVSTLVIPKVYDLIEKWGMDLGFVFQDSSHHYAESCIEWTLYHQLLSKGGIWLCDDITEAFYDPKVDPLNMGMVQYFESREGRKFLIPDVLHKGNTMGIIIND